MRIALQAGQEEEPELRGKTVAQATQLLRNMELGIKCHPQRTRADDKIQIKR